MAIWAIGDIHASKTDPDTGLPSKPMEVFGPQWKDHVSRLEAAWRRDVTAEDTVIVVGDSDWALHFEDALETLERLDRLPGEKLLIRGNHDYWWSSKTTGRVRKRLPASLRVVHNDSVEVERFNICGTKGSPVPGGVDWTPDNEKLLNRECLRLQMSLDARVPGLRTMVAIHYPPFYPGSGESAFTRVMEEAGVDYCVYGHLHGSAARVGPQGEWRGIYYRSVAGDAVAFQPVLVARDGELVRGTLPAGSA